MPTSPEVLELIRENQQRRDKVLDLGAQGLTEIPAEVYQLTHLEELELCCQYQKIYSSQCHGAFYRSIRTLGATAFCLNNIDANLAGFNSS